MNCSKKDITDNLKEYNSFIHSILRSYGVSIDYYDIHQELLLKTWEVLKDNNPKTKYLKDSGVKFPTFLYHVLSNKLVDIYRTKYNIRLQKVKEIREVEGIAIPEIPVLKIKALKVYKDNVLVHEESDELEANKLLFTLCYSEHSVYWKQYGFTLVKILDYDNPDEENVISTLEASKRNVAQPTSINDFSFEQQVLILKDGTDAESIRIKTDIEAFEGTLDKVELAIWTLMLESWSQKEIASILKEQGVAIKTQSTISRDINELRRKFKKFITKGEI